MVVTASFQQSGSIGVADCPSGLCGDGPIGSPRAPSQGAARGVDSMFIEEMIPHHDDAIAMAELALTRAEHPEIKQLAADVIRTQSAENAQMRDWYEEWYGESVPANGSGSFGMMGRGSTTGGGMMGGNFSDLTALEDAEQFDQAFIEQMIPHHQMGIMMARMVDNGSSRPEIQGLAEDIIRTQSEEIDRMQQWYREWYGR
ncbi:MAG: DUF305 domain-containing protein [Actinobacteria bacterium HGW-Actinobacteria-6]|nr:MAG: DUF305 domain-containing protein [Actinobacteria bacterium HGW-Actinobacteria-6]